MQERYDFLFLPDEAEINKFKIPDGDAFETLEATYNVRNILSGKPTCNCPSWIYGRGRQGGKCKHIRFMEIAVKKKAAMVFVDPITKEVVRTV